MKTGMPLERRGKTGKAGQHVGDGEKGVGKFRPKNPVVVIMQ
ncbi:hypothetical protein [Caballeronia sp.]|jgi:hypothetical protein